MKTLINALIIIRAQTVRLHLALIHSLFKCGDSQASKAVANDKSERVFRMCKEASLAFENKDSKAFSAFLNKFCLDKLLNFPYKIVRYFQW